MDIGERRRSGTGKNLERKGLPEEGKIVVLKRELLAEVDCYHRPEARSSHLSGSCTSVPLALPPSAFDSLDGSRFVHPAVGTSWPSAQLCPRPRRLTSTLALQAKAPVAPSSPLKESTTAAPVEPVDAASAPPAPVAVSEAKPSAAAAAASAEDDDKTIGAEPSGEVIDMEVFGQLLEIVRLFSSPCAPLPAPPRPSHRPHLGTSGARDHPALTGSEPAWHAGAGESNPAAQ